MAAKREKGGRERKEGNKEGGREGGGKKVVRGWLKSLEQESHPALHFRWQTYLQHKGGREML